MQDITLKLAIDDVNVILEAVGALPFSKVYALVGKIQEQAAQQIRAERAAQADHASSAHLAVEAAG